MVRYIFTQEECIQWLNNKNYNPRTERKIKKDGYIWKQLVTQCKKFNLSLVKKEIEKQPFQDITELYLLFLDVKDINKLRITCNNNKNIIDSKRLWVKLLKRDFNCVDKLTPRDTYFFKYVDYNIMLKRSFSIPIDFLKRKIKYLPWNGMLRYIILNRRNYKLFEKYDYKMLGGISLHCNRSLTSEMIDKYPKEWLWNKISQYIVLTKTFIEKYKNKLDWYYICWNQTFTEELIDKYKDNIKWCVLSRRGNLNEKIVFKYEKYWNWGELSQNSSALTINVLNKYKRELHWNHVWQYIELKDIHFNNKFLYNFIVWYTISRNETLTSDMIEKHKDKIDFKQLPMSKHTIKIIEKYKLYNEYNYLWYNFKSSIKVLKYLEKKDKNIINWNDLSKYIVLDLDMFKTFRDKWDISELCKNDTLSQEMIRLVEKELSEDNYDDLWWNSNSSLENQRKARSYRYNYIERECKDWLKNRKINPRTGRKIKKGGSVYKKFLSRCKHYKLIQ